MGKKQFDRKQPLWTGTRGVLAAAVLVVMAGAAILPLTTAADAAAVVVEMTNQLNYQPSEVTIQAGQTVEWRNSSLLVHTVTADPEEASKPSHVHVPEGAEPFNSGKISPGETYRHTFAVPGEYRYFCIPHEAAEMIGTVVVKPKGTTAASP